MVKAVIQVILELAIAEDRQALHQRVCDERDLSLGEHEKMYRILDLPVETSSSQLHKNVKMLYGQLDIDPSMVVHLKCPTKECQNVFIDVVGKDGWDKVPGSCPECGTALREGRKLVTEFFSRHTLQAKLEYKPILHSWQRQHDEQMERPAYLQDTNPGKIPHHQLDGSCYQVDDQDVQHEHGCLVLTINVSINWADPSKSCNHPPRSMGPIMCQLANLPNKYRSQYLFMMLMGITPAPNEPPDCLLHHLLLPLAIDILRAECDGLWIKTLRYPNGHKVNTRIGTICYDQPASVIVTGCAHFRRKDSPCLKCLAGHLTKATQAYTETLKKSIFAVPSHLSALDLFLNFDKFLHAAIDPMHALLEGILPFYIQKVLVLGRYDCHKLGYQHSKCPTRTCATVPKANQLETELTAGNATLAYLMLAQTIPSADDGTGDMTYALFHPLLSILVPVPTDNSLPAPSPKFLS
ncbi:hypothetical protein C365_06883 [Cryptococcus neoformans Bt85]|nr:hypothetical protein C365_06883 [Cryptococcus neoformans var. grubii Bt85]